MPKINLNQIGEVEVETLPFRESRYQYLQRKIGGMWSYNCNIEYHYYHPENNPYKISKRIIENNVGKSFDMAFHYYCTKVEQRYQKQFLEDFNDTRWYRRFNDYYVDDNGNIQVNKKVYKHKKSKATVYSFDYEQVYLNKGVKITQGWKKEFEIKNKEYYKIRKAEAFKKKKLDLKIKEEKYLLSLKVLKESKDRIKKEKNETYISKCKYR